MKRFGPAKSVDEERDSVEAAVPSCTKYCTKWAYKIFEDWQLSRKNKVAIEEATALRFDNLSSVQDLDSVKLDELFAESLKFWLSKFVQEVAKKNGERYILHELFTRSLVVSIGILQRPIPIIVLIFWIKQSEGMYSMLSSVCIVYVNVGFCS